MKIEWLPVNIYMPNTHIDVLIHYYKGGKSIITQGYLANDAVDLASESHPESFWKKIGKGFTWYDTQRQIQSLNAKKSKNKVTHWAILPEQP